jgi:pimeloyl-ACP methyl ester carboxylesterase
LSARLALCVLILLVTPLGAHGEEIVTLKTRGDVSQSYLLAYDKGTSYKAVAVLFPGGEGRIELKESPSGITLRGGNFVVRTRDLFVANGIAAAVIDNPSDNHGFTDVDRMGKAHMTDVGAVVADLRQRFPGAKVFLVGTSRGTVSAAYAGIAHAERIDGVVLTSTVFRASRNNAGVSGLNFSGYKAPLLFVHHRQDACSACPYNEAARHSERLISVSGGDAPQSGPCEPFSQHGYLGKEKETVAAISRWLLGEAFPREVN